jgi:isopentenyl phosphate kinase
MKNANLLVLKLGGSLITEMVDSRPECNIAVTKELVRQIGNLDTIPILIHGTGSFGKPPVIQYAYPDGYLSKFRSNVVSIVSALLEKLSVNVIQLIRNAGLAVLPINVASLFRVVNGKFILCQKNILHELLQRNVMPVISGGFVVDDKTGFVVCSSDIIASEIAIQLNAEKLILATSVPGIYRNLGVDEEICHELTLADSQSIKISDSSYDVSGGMAAKIKAGFAAVAHNIDTYIIDGRVPNNIGLTTCNQLISGTRLVGHK